MNNMDALLLLTQNLVARQIAKTQFATIKLPSTALAQGIPLGQGKCIGVILYVNSLVLNTATKTATANNLNQIYYGDNQKQFRELVAGQPSDILFCTDLEQIFIRGNGVENHVQVTIYLASESDSVELYNSI
jgi:hypothetical protein